MSKRELPDLPEHAEKVRFLITIAVAIGIFSFTVWKFFPLFHSWIENQWAVSAAVGLGLSMAYFVVALDRYTDDYRRQLDFLDHFFFLLGNAAISGGAGALAGVLGSF